MDKAAECYRRYRSGDERGFDELMELLRENLIVFLLRILPSEEDAEDAAEDAFVELLLHPYREDRGASLKTYLFTLGRSRALNLLKKQKRSAPLEDPEPSPETALADYEEALCRTEARRELLAALKTLPDDQRQAVYLLYLEDFTLDETARVMKKNKKQIENLSYRARCALRERLGKEALLP